MSTFKKHGFLWIIGLFFVSSLVLHWYFAWVAHQSQEQDFIAATSRDVFENWQSEFLQLGAQIGLLSIFWAVGSPSSKTEEERVEAKLDRLIRELLPRDYADTIIKEYDNRYPKR
jgi:hypothetical protein